MARKPQLGCNIKLQCLNPTTHRIYKITLYILYAQGGIVNGWIKYI